MARGAWSVQYAVKARAMQNHSDDDDNDHGDDAEGLDRGGCSRDPGIGPACEDQKLCHY
jgi:hypothetical protein